MYLGLSGHYRIFKGAVDRDEAQENDKLSENNSLSRKSGSKKTRRGRRGARD
jgi:hypothetical protein